MSRFSDGIVQVMAHQNLVPVISAKMPIEQFEIMTCVNVWPFKAHVSVCSWNTAKLKCPLHDSVFVFR